MVTKDTKLNTAYNSNHAVFAINNIIDRINET